MNHVPLFFIPVSLALRYLLDVQPIWIFVAGAAAIGVLADWVRRATEQLAHRAGATIGGLLNVSFGNSPNWCWLFSSSPRPRRRSSRRRHRIDHRHDPAVPWNFRIGRRHRPDEANLR